MGHNIIFHIDVNAAYLSWEAVYRLQRGEALDLRSVPSVIGGDEDKRSGIVLAKSQPAKKDYHIQTGETLGSARQKCPQLLVLPPNYLLYMQCSDAMVELLNTYSPAIQRYSIDEMFLDYTNLEHHFGTAREAANTVKEHIKSELGFTVNIGIGPNKLLAKMASEFQKPDRVHTLFEHEIPDKMWPLPVGELFMVGRATEKKLRDRGIDTIGDLANESPHRLKLWLKSHGLLIWNYAHGIENSPVVNSGPLLKGLGNSTTTPHDIRELKTAELLLLSLLETVTGRLRKSQKCAQVISVSIKNDPFQSKSHQKKLSSPTDSTDHLFDESKNLLSELWDGTPIRHMGIHLTHLSDWMFYQYNLFDYPLSTRPIDAVVDDIRRKYGKDSLIRSSFLWSPIPPFSGGVTSEKDYPMMSSLL